ncbi:hypothetical protein MRX96_044388 [Rhipicephalus microplus]
MFTVVDKVRLCSLCSYATKSSYNMAVHLRTHTGEKPHQCCRCYRLFRTQSQRACHSKECTGVPVRHSQPNAQAPQDQEPVLNLNPELELLELPEQVLSNDLPLQMYSPHSVDQETPQSEPESPPQSPSSLLPTL